MSTFRAPWVAQVELAAPLHDLVAPRRLRAAPYDRARVLVRLHGEPIGTLELPLRDGRLTLLRLLEAVDAELGPALDARLAGPAEGAA